MSPVLLPSTATRPPIANRDQVPDPRSRPLAAAVRVQALPLAVAADPFEPLAAVELEPWTLIFSESEHLSSDLLPIFLPIVFSRYLEPLSVALENEKWSLVQLLMSSSYTGYGICSLEQDSSEIDELINYLINKENSEGVMLLGHSTGCQDIVHYMGTNVACSKAVRGVILQAPVSDREHRATLPVTAIMTELARTMISEGKALELMPRKAEPAAPITAYRYHSLCAHMGDDDMFSSDLTDEQLKSKLGHMANTPCQVIFSMADEQVPDHVDKKALAARLCKAMGGAEKVEIEWGNHTLSNRVEEAVTAILGFVKREDDPWS